MPWQAPTMTVKWGSYFAPDAADEKLIVDTVVASAPHTTQRMRMEKLAPIFSIENVEAALAELEEEQQAQADADLERTQNELAAAHALTNADSSSKAPGRAGAGADKKQAPGGRSGGPPTAKPKA
jgi:hypothetical protein